MLQLNSHAEPWRRDGGTRATVTTTGLSRPVLLVCRLRLPPILKRRHPARSAPVLARSDSGGGRWASMLTLAGSFLPAARSSPRPLPSLTAGSGRLPLPLPPTSRGQARPPPSFRSGVSGRGPARVRLRRVVFQGCPLPPPLRPFCLGAADRSGLPERGGRSIKETCCRRQ